MRAKPSSFTENRNRSCQIKPVLLNAPVSIHDNLDPDSTLTEKSDMQTSRRLLSFAGKSRLTKVPRFNRIYNSVETERLYKFLMDLPRP
jgi:hypothetical protein